MWRYIDLLPVEIENETGLGEGMTPLIKCKQISKKLGIKDLFIKDESRNPTWSYKDRLCSVAVRKAKELGATAIVVSSTGNHGAAAAAFAARAGLPCIAFTIESVPATMKVLMQSYNAKLVATKKSEERWILMREGIRRFGWVPVSNFTDPPVGSNYFGIEGYKTIAYEICESLNWEVPQFVIMPVAYADGLWGTWKGFCELYLMGLIDRKPKMVAAEPFGPLKNALDKGLDFPEKVKAGSSIAFSIAAPNSTYQGLKALKDSKGYAVTVTDEEIISMQKLLGSNEGLFPEPSSVAPVVAAQKLRDTGIILNDDKVVCILTSSGLKDPNTPAGYFPKVPVCEPNLDFVLDTFKKIYNFEMQT
jgi:threonine synthase